MKLDENLVSKFLNNCNETEYSLYLIVYFI